MLETAIKAAKAAGKVIKEDYAKIPTIAYKDVNNIVTETDKRAEKAILDIIKKKYPEHGIFSEEAGLIEKKSEYYWIIDPLDGTTNFSRHVGYFGVSIALLHRNELKLGVLYDPLANELFSAEAGQGVMCNGERIHIGQNTLLNRAVVSLTRGTAPAEKIRHGKIYDRMVTEARSTRALGSTALQLCHTACGRLDALICNSCNFYDCAAGVIMAREAGALVTTFTGAEPDFSLDHPDDILVASPALNKQLIPLLKNI